ncbi:complement factor H-related protein 1-like isoform X1 [Trachinotus anak]|uniref:complement factor H-related protein 1-like isoform X1 n=1 Tax=Trachinotus anak TaxID=443729 RepID=UPI0039F181B7
MYIRYFGFLLLIWFPGALHAQSATQSCSAPSLVGGFFVPKQVTYSNGTTLSYTCYDGRKPAMKGWWATTTCENGKWSHQPQCMDIKACIPPTILNGKYTENSNGWYENRHMIRISCDRGFEHKDQVATARCINGEWLSLPVCQKSTTACTEPPKVPHAVIIHQAYQEVFAIDSEVVYECEDGYTIEGAHTNKSIFCIAGTWTEGPTCRPSATSGSNERENQTQTTSITNCGEHPTIVNGDVVEINDMFLRFSCNSFYRRVGPEKVKCYADRTWSEVPTCKDAYCSVNTAQYPDLIHDGVIYLKYDDNVELKCRKLHWYWASDHYSVVRCSNGRATLSKCKYNFKLITSICHKQKYSRITGLSTVFSLLIVS